MLLNEEHFVPQEPQLDVSVKTLISQPFEKVLSQSAKPWEQLCVVQVPALQVPIVLGTVVVQIVPSGVPPPQGFVEHCPDEQTAFGPGHTVPHAPQLLISLFKLVPQGEVPQFVNPGRQAPGTQFPP